MKLKTNTKSSKKMINASTDDTFSFTHERLSIYIWCFMFRSIYQTKNEEKPNEPQGERASEEKNHSYAPTHMRIGARRLTPPGKTLRKEIARKKNTDNPDQGPEGVAAEDFHRRLRRCQGGDRTRGRQRWANKRKIFCTSNRKTNAAKKANDILRTNSTR